MAAVALGVCAAVRNRIKKFSSGGPAERISLLLVLNDQVSWCSANRVSLVNAHKNHFIRYTMIVTIAAADSVMQITA